MTISYRLGQARFQFEHSRTFERSFSEVQYFNFTEFFDLERHGMTSKHILFLNSLQELYLYGISQISIVFELVL